MKRQPEKKNTGNKFVRENQMGEEGPSPVRRDVFVPIFNFLDAHLGPGWEYTSINRFGVCLRECGPHTRQVARAVIYLKRLSTCYFIGIVTEQSSDIHCTKVNLPKSPAWNVIMSCWRDTSASSGTRLPRHRGALYVVISVSMKAAAQVIWLRRHRHKILAKRGGNDG